MIVRDVCPTCGSDVVVHSGAEGTSFMLPANTADQTQAFIERDKLHRAVNRASMLLAKALANNWVARDDVRAAYATLNSFELEDEPLVCPNGHPIPLVQTIACDTDDCAAYVTYVPMAHALAVDRRLSDALGAAHHAAACLEDISDAVELPKQLLEQVRANVDAVARLLAAKGER